MIHFLFQPTFNRFDWAVLVTLLAFMPPWWVFIPVILVAGPFSVYMEGRA